MKRSHSELSGNQIGQGLEIVPCDGAASKQTKSGDCTITETSIPVSNRVWIQRSNIPPRNASGFQGNLGKQPFPPVLSPILENQAKDDEEEIIGFALRSKFEDDHALEKLFPNPRALAFATMLRDLQVVASTHVESMITANLLPNNDLRVKPFTHTRETLLPNEGFLEFVSKLLDVHQVFTENTYEVAEYQVGSVDDTGKTVFAQMNKSGLHFSSLIGQFVVFNRTVDPQRVEITDYCLRKHPNYEPNDIIFHAPGGQPVLRREFWCMELNQPILPSIVNAWARVLIHLWTAIGRGYRTCLEVVYKGEVQSDSSAVLKKWERWIKACDIRIPEVELISIPICDDGHYCVVFVNFRNNTIQCINTSFTGNRLEAYKFGSQTVKIFWKFLARCQDSRLGLKPLFTMEMCHPQWGKNMSEADMGVTAMHLMEQWNLSPAINSLMLAEETVRIHLRVVLCSGLVISPINLHRGLILPKVGEMIAEKNSYLSP